MTVNQAPREQLDATSNADRYAQGWRFHTEPTEPIPLTVGQRVKLSHDGRRWWTVRAMNGAAVVLTRQAEFRPRGVLRYTVIDWRLGVRGPANTLGRVWDCDLDENCEELAKVIQTGEFEISQRSWAPIDLALNPTYL